MTHSNVFAIPPVTSRGREVGKRLVNPRPSLAAVGTTQPNLINNMINEKFRRQVSNRRFMRGQRNSKGPKIPDMLAVSYQIRVTAGGEVVKELNSTFEIPEVQDPDYLAAAADFLQLFDMLVAKPLAMAVASFQSRRADRCQKQSDRSVGDPQATDLPKPQTEFKSPQLPNDFPDVLPQPTPPANK